MRILSAILSICVLSFGAWWVNHNHPELRYKVEEILHRGEFNTLEIAFSAAQIMETHRKDLLKDNRHRYLEPQLKFYPYLLMEVKYSPSVEATKEGVILWDMIDGEMVLDTKDWEKTHGFADCIKANTQSHEFKILSLLAKKGGAINREQIGQSIKMESEILNAWLESCMRKKLIVQAGDKFRLHLQNPRLKWVPETKIAQWLVSKPFKDAIRIPKRFSVKQIEKFSKAAFGTDYTIRKTEYLYLPVHSIIVQNPDGSVQTTYWNALNGKNLSQVFSLH